MAALFDKFSILDPKRELDQVVAEIGVNPFDQFSLLDPVRYHKQIETAVAESIFTQFSHDPEFAEGQMENAFVAIGPFHFIAATLQAASGTKPKAAQKMLAKMTALAASGEVTAAAQRMSMIESAVASAGRAGV